MDNSKNSGKVIKAGIGYTIGNVLVRGLSFLTLPIFSRLLSTSDYGLYSSYITYENIFYVVIGLVLHNSLKSAKVEFGDERIDEYTSTVVLLPIAFTVVLSIVGYLFRFSISNLLGITSNVIVLMILQAWAASVLTLYNNRIAIDYSAKRYLIITIVNSLSNVVVSLFLIVFIYKENPYIGRVLGTFIPAQCIALYILYALFKKAKPRMEKQYCAFGIRYSLPLIPHGLSQVVLSQFGKIVILKTIGSDAAGIYGFAYTIASIPQILAASLDTAYSPWFFETYKRGDYALIREKTKQYIVLFSTITIGIVLASPEIILLMGSKAYLSSRRIVGPAIIGVYFTFLYGVVANIEYYYKKTKFIAIGTALAALINIVLNVLTVKQFGYEIAVYVNVVTYVLYFIFHLLIARTISRDSFPFDLKPLTILPLLCVLCATFSQVFLSCYIVRYLVLLGWLLVFGIKYKKELINLVRVILNGNKQ